MLRRFTILLPTTVVILIIVPLAAPQVIASSPGTFKEKIVFVRADPSIGVSAMRTITVANDTAGRSSELGLSTSTHDVPDMQATAFANAKKNEIALMNPDGSNVTRLHVFGSDPALSPDGTKIAYCSMRETQYSQIYVMNSDDTGEKRLTNFNTGDACGPSWSHDGSKLAFHAFALMNPRRNPEIWVMNADGSNQKRLTEHGLDPFWSPDGRQIAFASKRDGIFQIYAMNADGSNIRRLTKHNAEDSNPAWAPDGGAIAFVSVTGDDRRGLFIMASDGSELHGIAHSKHQDFCFPSWSLDGKTIAFTALNRLGPQSIVVGEERPRCEMWSGEYQLFALDSEGKIHQLSDAKLMGMRPAYGRIVPSR
jgi:dipeptidyl aminopeptidase/acylaminoacyl peptidase